MALAIIKGDPYDFPKSIVPAGLAYQWCAKTVLSEPQTTFNELCADGWVPVPLAWHRDLFDCLGPEIEIGGQVLLCRTAQYVQKQKEKERQKIDTLIDGWSKQAGIDGLSGGVYVWTGDAKPPEFRSIGDPHTAKIILDKTKEMAQPQREIKTKFLSREPRHRLLRWLFNLISVEKES